MFSNPDTEQIREILGTAKRIAVVGISNRADRASRYVSEYMQREGYEVIPHLPARSILNENELEKYVFLKKLKSTDGDFSYPLVKRGFND